MAWDPREWGLSTPSIPVRRLKQVETDESKILDIIFLSKFIFVWRPFSNFEEYYNLFQFFRVESSSAHFGCFKKKKLIQFFFVLKTVTGMIKWGHKKLQTLKIGDLILGSFHNKNRQTSEKVKRLLGNSVRQEACYIIILI